MQKVIVKQIRGMAGRTRKVRDTLKSLGLGRIGKSREHTLTPDVRGKLIKVAHMVEVKSADS
ncbi:MAG: 50S ribosomal protein L30 [Candidatus Dadabacteria bacterium]|nr:MAG: 50S ribosomal protein L30 [Candidatus Dadabacteria bacterium]